PPSWTGAACQPPPAASPEQIVGRRDLGHVQQGDREIGLPVMVGIDGDDEAASADRRLHRARADVEQAQVDLVLAGLEVGDLVASAARLKLEDVAAEAAGQRVAAAAAA